MIYKSKFDFFQIFKVGLSRSKKKMCYLLYWKLFENEDLKTLFVLKILKFFLVMLKKRLDQKEKVNFKIRNVTIW